MMKVIIAAVALSVSTPALAQDYAADLNTSAVTRSVVEDAIHNARAKCHVWVKTHSSYALALATYNALITPGPATAPSIFPIMMDARTTSRCKRLLKKPTRAIPSSEG